MTREEKIKALQEELSILKAERSVAREAAKKDIEELARRLASKLRYDSSWQEVLPTIFARAFVLAKIPIMKDESDGQVLIWRPKSKRPRKNTAVKVTA